MTLTSLEAIYWGQMVLEIKNKVQCLWTYCNCSSQSLYVRLKRTHCIQVTTYITLNQNKTCLEVMVWLRFHDNFFLNICHIAFLIQREAFNLYHHTNIQWVNPSFMVISASNFIFIIINFYHFINALVISKHYFLITAKVQDLTRVFWRTWASAGSILL